MNTNTEYTPPPSPGVSSAKIENPEGTAATATAAQAHDSTQKPNTGDSSQSNTQTLPRTPSGAGSSVLGANPANPAVLNSSVKTGKLPKARKAIGESDVRGLLVAYGCNVSGDRWAEWERDLEGTAIGVVGAILDWRSERGKPVREPSGWRAAKESWDNLQDGSKRELARYFQSLMEGK